MDQPTRREGVTNEAGQRPHRASDTFIKRSSRRQHEDRFAGSWKIAFADFCLALMCLFLVLWLMTARDKEEAERMLFARGDSLAYDSNSPGSSEGKSSNERVLDGRLDGSGARLPVNQSSDSNADSTNVVPTLIKRRYESPDDWRTLEPLLRKMSRTAGLAANLQMVITPSGLRVLLHDTDQNGIFPSGSASPAQPFRTLLRQLGQTFAKIDNPILIVGHTDAVPYINHGKYSNNWNLSVHRAMAARNDLMEGGMQAERVLQVIGMADRAPLNTDDPRAAVNRRIEFLVLTEKRAQKIVQMFGVPSAVTPLAEGVNAALTDPSQQNKLLKDFGLKPPP